MQGKYSCALSFLLFIVSTLCRNAHITASVLGGECLCHHIGPVRIPTSCLDWFMLPLFALAFTALQEHLS